MSRSFFLQVTFFFQLLLFAQLFKLHEVNAFSCDHSWGNHADCSFRNSESSNFHLWGLLHWLAKRVSLRRGWHRIGFYYLFIFLLLNELPCHSKHLYFFIWLLQEVFLLIFYNFINCQLLHFLNFFVPLLGVLKQSFVPSAFHINWLS